MSFVPETDDKMLKTVRDTLKELKTSDEFAKLLQTYSNPTEILDFIDAKIDANLEELKKEKAKGRVEKSPAKQNKMVAMEKLEIRLKAIEVIL